MPRKVILSRDDLSGPINMNRIFAMESSLDPTQVNQGSGATGLGQIRQGALDDFNRRNKTSHKLGDLLNPSLNAKVANWYMNKEIPRLLQHYGMESTPQNILAAYNAGVGNVRKGRIPNETQEYIRRYQDPNYFNQFMGPQVTPQHFGLE